MRVAEVKVEDGKLCAQLINLLRAGRWELSGPDILAHTQTVAWVHNLARLIASQLGTPAPAVASSPDAPAMKITGMGPLPKKAKKTRTR